MPRNSLTRYTAWHLRIKRLVQFIFAGPVHYNVLTTCATLLCRACLDEITCVAVMYLTLRTGCSRGRTPKVVRPQQRKNPLPFPFSKRSHIGNLRQIRKQGKGRSSKRKENRRLSFLFAHRRGYGVVPAAGAATSPRRTPQRPRRPQTANPPAEVQRKTCRPDRANRLRQFECPGQPVLKRSRPSGVNRPRGSCAPEGRCRKTRDIP